MIIEKIHRSEIRPAAYNPRKISIEAKRKLALSLNEFDLVEPLVWNRQTGNLVGGHQRLYILDEKNGTDYEVEVSIVDLPPAKEKALNVALNNQLMAGEWDFPKLNDLIVEIDTGEFDIEITGFNYGELEKIIGYERPGSGNGGAPEAQINKADELQKKWRVERGQIWEIGNHRLMCGDATIPQNVDDLLAGIRPLLMVTDPPYGVKYDPMFRERALGAADRRTGTVPNDDKAGWSDAWVLSLSEIAYIWHSDRFAIQSGLDLEKNGFEIRATIIWKKSHMPFGQGHYTFQHESCWYAVRKNSTAHWIGAVGQSTVWEISNDETVEGEHGTQKPIECMARAIRNHDGDIYDPFLGSGTTMVAAEQLGRICYGMEIHPPYCAVTLQRMTDMGLKPQLVSNQKP